MILRLTRDGRLASLRSVTCFQWRVSLETMLFLIDQCCQLNTIFGLDLLMLCPESISIIQEHITRNNRDITLRDASLLEKTSKGIPFLSERSRHRLEAADQISEDDRLEHILKEGTLEDLLKEVKHYY